MLLKYSWPKHEREGRFVINITKLLFVLMFIVSFGNYAQKESKPAIIINGDWTKSLDMVVNIGENSQNFESILFDEILNLEKIRKIKNFKSPSQTKIILSTYELQHRRVVDFVALAVSEGFQVEVVADGNILHHFTELDQEEIDRLTDRQKEYYYRNYDLDGNGIVSSSDAQKYNAKYELTRWCWSELQKTQQASPSLLKLIASPYEVVPDPNLNFPRIHHWKEYTIQFRENEKWLDVKSFIPSSNLTNTCLNHEQGRISGSFVNQLRYTRAPLPEWEEALAQNKIRQADFNHFVNATGEDKYKIAFARTAKDKITGDPLRNGHVQFGMIFKDPLVLQILKEQQLKNWELGYKKNLFFDQLSPRSSYYPEIIFDNKKNKTYSKLRAFFSEGVQLSGAESDFVFTAYNTIFSDPGNSIRVFKTSQFVATHPKIISKINLAMMSEKFEEAFMVVDGNFSTETYSAFPSLVLSQINDQPMTPWTKSISANHLSQKRKSQILNSMFSFDGQEGIYGGKDGIKLHAKMSYIEYVDSRNVRHYVVIHGSGNLSVNAGKGNADGLIVFDTTDSKLKSIIDPYFEGLKQNPRTKDFLSTYLQKRLAHVINYNEQALREVKARGFERSSAAKFIESNYELLNINKGTLTYEFSRLLKGQLSEVQEKLALASAINLITKNNNGSDFSKNLLKTLRFYQGTGAPLRFEEFHQMLYLSNPQNNPSSGFIKRLRVEWLKRVTQGEKITLTKKYHSLVSRLSRFHAGDGQSYFPTAIELEILANCNQHFKNLNLNSKEYLKLNTKGGK